MMHKREHTYHEYNSMIGAVLIDQAKCGRTFMRMEKRTHTQWIYVECKKCLDAEVKQVNHRIQLDKS